MDIYPAKRINLKNASNFRDLGGFYGDGDRVTRWNTLFRSDRLDLLTGEEWKTLKNMDLKKVVDLRSLSESRAFPVNVPEGVSYKNCPIQSEQIDMRNIKTSAGKAFSGSMREGYRNIVDNNMLLIVRALKEIVTGLESGGVVFHCTAGKDRTGIIAAIILKILGVCDEDIIADYQVSFTYNKKNIGEFLNNPEFKGIQHLFRSDFENMELLTEHFYTVDIIKKLNENGFDERYISDLKRKMLTDT